MHILGATAADSADLTWYMRHEGNGLSGDSQQPAAPARGPRGQRPSSSSQAGVLGLASRLRPYGETAPVAELTELSLQPHQEGYWLLRTRIFQQMEVGGRRLASTLEIHIP